MSNTARYQVTMERELNMPDLQIPHSAERLTSQWLTEALASTGVITNSTVTSFNSERLGVGQGFVGQIVRLGLTYDSGEDAAPQSIIAKFPSTDPAIRSVLNGLRIFEREVRFYKEVAPLIELSTPQCYYGATDGEAGDHVLLLEDLAPARVGNRIQSTGRPVAGHDFISQTVANGPHLPGKEVVPVVRLVLVRQNKIVHAAASAGAVD